MRKRKAVRPMLESMEDRLVLSRPSAFDPTAQIRSAFTALFPSHQSHPAAAHHARPEAARPHHAARATRAAHHQQQQHHHHRPRPSHSNSNSNSGNSFSNFFKSVFPGL